MAMKTNQSLATTTVTVDSHKISEIHLTIDLLDLLAGSRLDNNDCDTIVIHVNQISDLERMVTRTIKFSAYPRGY